MWDKISEIAMLVFGPNPIAMSKHLLLLYDIFLHKYKIGNVIFDILDNIITHKSRNHECIQ
jgi:hypothetical protein